MSNVFSLSGARKVARPKIRTVISTADTGTLPFLAEADDDTCYWCKTFFNNHGWESVVNELVGSIVGNAIDAPILDWAILDIPSELVGVRTPKSQNGHCITLDDRPVFATANIHANNSQFPLGFLDHDGNYDRVPKLLALWQLCCAEDIQFLYDLSADFKIYSMDHGMWFTSQEENWGLCHHTTIAGRPPVPRIPDLIPRIHWERAIEATEKLDENLYTTVSSEVPNEWGVKDRDLAQLVDYVLGRKRYTIDQLTKNMRRHSGR